MKKYLFIVLLVSSVFGQSINPCEDERYLEIKNKSLDEMSDREYEYFKQKDKECSEFGENYAPKTVENKTDFNFERLIGGIYIDEETWAINSYSRLYDSWGFGLLYAISVDEDGFDSENYMPYISYEFPTGSRFLSPSLVVGVNYSARYWYIQGVSGEANNVSPYFGVGLNINITNKIGVGIVGAMAEAYRYMPYEDGTSDIYDQEYIFLPAVTVNLYDLFSN